MPARSGDAFGTALLDWARGGALCEIIERDDGHFEDGAGPDGYLTGFREWPKAQRQALRHLRGRVVDGGCGAGRVAVELQQRGYDVVGVDASPLAIRAARLVGVRTTRCLALEALAELGQVDSILLFGNNFGIFATPTGARRTLIRWARCLPTGTRLFAESTDPYSGGAPIIDRSYYWRNKARGLPPGRTRFRVWYRGVVGPWVTWLFVSRQELRAITRGTGWRVVTVFEDGRAEPFVVMLERE